MKRKKFSAKNLRNSFTTAQYEPRGNPLRFPPLFVLTISAANSNAKDLNPVSIGSNGILISTASIGYLPVNYNISTWLDIVLINTNPCMEFPPRPQSKRN